MQANISKNAEPEDWRYREAATTALGAILEGPSTERLAAYVSQGLSFLLHAMKDTHQQVRHSTAWTIGTPLIMLIQARLHLCAMLTRFCSHVITCKTNMSRSNQV